MQQSSFTATFRFLLLLALLAAQAILAAPSGATAVSSYLSSPLEQTPSLTFEPANGLFFGSPAVGCTYSSPADQRAKCTQTLTITNSGSESANIGRVFTNDRHFDLVSSNCAVLDPGASCSAEVLWYDEELPEGTQLWRHTQGELQIWDDLGHLFPVRLDATGVVPSPTVVALGPPGPPVAALSPGGLDFGSVPKGIAHGMEVQLTNKGDSPLSIQDYGILGDFWQNLTGDAGGFSITVPSMYHQLCPKPGALAPGAACSLWVFFQPEDETAHTRTLEVTTDASGSPHRITLSGTGSQVSLSTTTFDFGDVPVGGEAGQMVTLTNNSSMTLTFTDHPSIPGILGMPNVDFYDLFPGSGCSKGDKLAPGGSCGLGVRFAPRSGQGVKTATLYFNTDAPDSPHTVRLSGNAVLPTASFDAGSLDFGEVLLNRTVTRTATLTNTSSWPLAIKKVELVSPFLQGPAGFSVAGCDSGPLAAGASCTVTASFTPTDAGARNRWLKVTTDASNSPHEVTLAGTGATSLPGVSLSLASLDFGSRRVNTTSPASTITLTNSGNIDLKISSITLAGSYIPFSKTSGCPVSPDPLAAGESCTIDVTYTPTGRGDHSSTLKVYSNAPGSPHELPLSGTGLQSALTLSATELDFGTEPTGTTSAPKSVTLTNSGNDVLNISSISSGNSGIFPETNDCGSSLAAQASCTLSVAFSPPSGPGGNFGTYLSIKHDGPGREHLVMALGTGVGPKVSLSTANLDFGGVAVNSVSGPLRVTLSNTGGGPLSIGQIDTSSYNFGQTSDCPVSPSTLAAGASCSVDVVFAPTGLVDYSESLIINDNAPGGFNRSVALTGSGGQPEVSLNPTALRFDIQPQGSTSPAQTVTLTNSGTVPLTVSSISTTRSDFTQSNDCPASPATLGVGESCAIAVSFSPSGGGLRTGQLAISSDASPGYDTVDLRGLTTSISLSPANLDFGDQPKDTTGPAQAVTLTNSGGRPIAISDVVIDGTDSTDFTLAGDSCTKAALQPERSCSLSLAFKPGATGVRTARLSFSHDDRAGGSPVSVPLSGTGITVVVALDPTSLDFGSRPKDSASQPRSVTLTNHGSAALTLRALRLAGTNPEDFKVNSDGCSGAQVAPEGSCTVSLSFKPTAAGGRGANLIFEDTTGTAHTVPLSGTGLAPAVTFSPSTLDFGSLPVGALSPSAQQVELKNTGNAQLTGLSISIAGTNPADFLQSNYCGSTLNAGASCWITVRFRPQAADSRSAALTATSSAGTSTASLTGAGQGAGATLSPASISFADQTTGGTGAAQTVTLTSSGTSALDIYSIATSGDFGVVGHNCTVNPAYMPVGQSCTISISFTPTTGGSRTGALTITTNASNSPHKVSLSGTGRLPSPTPAPPSDDSGEPGPAPAPTATATIMPTPMPTGTPGPTATPTAIPTITATVAPTATGTATPARPANDDFTNAQVLTLPASATGSTVNATVEAGEPLWYGGCRGLWWNSVHNSVWFRFTPSSSGTLTASTANTGTTFDTVLLIYTGSSLDSLTLAACDNNGDWETPPGSTPQWSSIVHTPVTAGTTYYLQLGGVGGAPSGSYNLTVSLVPDATTPTATPTATSTSTPTATATASPPAVATPRIIATTTVGSQPESVGVNPTTNLVYVANVLGNSVSVIDGSSNEVVATVAVGTSPAGVGVNPTTNRIYVANRGSNTVSVLNGTNNAIVSTIAIGSMPQGIAVNPTTNRIFVANTLGSTVAVIDGSTDAVIATIAVSSAPRYLGVDPTTNRVYLANEWSDSVSVIDGSTFSILTSVPVGSSPRGVGVNRATHNVYAANYNSCTVSTIAGASNTVASTIAVGVDPVAIGVNPTTNHIFLTDRPDDGPDAVSMIDGATNSIVSSLLVEGGPYAVGVNPTTNRVYVVSRWGNSVTVIEDGAAPTATPTTAPTSTTTPAATATPTTAPTSTTTPAATATPTSTAIVTGVYWTGAAGDGYWDTPGNWSSGAVPGPADDVYIDQMVEGSVTYRTGDTTIHSLNNRAGLLISGGSLSLSAASEVSVSGFITVAGGTLTGTGELVVKGTLGWTGGTMSGYGSTTIAQGGTLNILGTGNRQLSTRTMNNSGAVVWGDTAYITVYAATINNLATGVFDVRCDQPLNVAGYGAAPSFNNYGVFKKSAGYGVTTLNITLYNYGSVLAQSGTLKLAGGSISDGSFDVSSGVDLEFGGLNHRLEATSSLTGAGTVRFTSGIVLVGGSYDITGATFITGGTANFDSDSATAAETHLSDGALGGTGTLTVTDYFSWKGGVMSGTGSTVIAPTGTLSIVGGVDRLLSGRTLNNSGAIWLTDIDSITAGDGAVINNLAGGTFDLRGPVGINYSGSGAAPTFNNGGLFERSSFTGTSFVNIAFNNTGTVEAQSGTLSFSASYVQTAGSTLLSGGDLGGTATIDLRGGSLSGGGTVSASLSNGGQLILAGTGSTGALSIAGDYTQTSTGALEVEIGGSAASNAFDRLIGSGKSALDGTLTVSLINGYSPAAGESFTVVTSSSRSGEFATINKPANLTTAYSATGVTLDGAVSPLKAAMPAVKSAPPPTPTPVTPTATSVVVATAGTATPTGIATMPLAPTETGTTVPSMTATATATATPTSTFVVVPTATGTPIATPTSTFVVMPTATGTPIATPTSTMTASPR